MRLIPKVRLQLLIRIRIRQTELISLIEKVKLKSVFIKTDALPTGMSLCLPLHPLSQFKRSVSEAPCIGQLSEP